MYRNLTNEEQQQLVAQGCDAKNWTDVYVKDGFDPQYVCDAHFSGVVKMGNFVREFELPGGLSIHSGINHATIHNCEIGDNVHLYNIHNYIANYRIGADTCIEKRECDFGGRAYHVRQRGACAGDERRRRA